MDVLTSGNHIWDKREIYDYLPRQPRLLRPANYPEGLPGSGMALVEARNGVRCAVLNLQGRTLHARDRLPVSQGRCAAGGAGPGGARSASWIFTPSSPARRWPWAGTWTAASPPWSGTHTHVPTADTRILPGGTAYQTDAGMTGPYNSVIGVEKQLIMRAIPDPIAGAHGSGTPRSGAARGDRRSGRSDGEGRVGATGRGSGITAPSGRGAVNSADFTAVPTRSRRRRFRLRACDFDTM